MTRWITHTSAALLGLSGAALLFASDAILPALVPGVPASAAPIGQLLGAAWLGLAALDWLQRDAVLGGIYGRPVVFANLVLSFVSALSVVGAGPASGAAWAVAGAAGALALAWGLLLFRGPFETPAPG